MEQLAMILLVNRANTGLINSALPNSPVVPDRPPGRVRLAVAAGLHRLASRLDGGAVPQWGYARVRSLSS
jgi:hypothetical protein